jgi:cysteinyl-tRNA synthetase
MSLRVYNTLTRQKEEFRTVQPGKVGMYLCGPTVYKPSHVGHMVGPVIFDTVKRYLSYLGYEVTFVVNITDVDDKIIKESLLESVGVPDLTERVTADYVRNLERLGVRIDRMPRVSGHIPDILALIQGLIEKGFAYPADGDVYFDISKDDDYGKLCNRDPEQMAAGARIEVSEKKRNPGDFALWKKAKAGEPSWESPWGPGRPGWHIECSAMANRLLGATLDIHGGGLDLTFPHHENELAQSESYTGQTFANFWMHNGLMKRRAEAKKIKDGAPVPAAPVDGGLETISKSKGNEIVVSEVFKRHEPEVLRLLLLASHYRSSIEYSEERLQELRRSLENFWRFFERYKRITRADFYALSAATRRAAFQVEGKNAFLEDVGRLRGMFLEAMDDDFNTGAAVGVLFELLSTLNRFADTRKLEDASPAAEDLASFTRGVVVLRELGQILGLFQQPPASASAGGDELVGQLMQVLIDLRNEARKTKNFAMADQIRTRLTQIGVTLEDRPGGTGWRRG